MSDVGEDVRHVGDVRVVGDVRDVGEDVGQEDLYKKVEQFMMKRWGCGGVCIAGLYSLGAAAIQTWGHKIW